jgi:hypothetical protein
VQDNYGYCAVAKMKGVFMELISSSEKQCRKCNKLKAYSQFDIDRGKKDGYHLWCKDCREKRNKEKYISDPLLAREKNLRRMYGITAEQYQVMFNAQKGLCAACGKPETAIDKRTGTLVNLHVDHDHKTGAVRALLCQGCNIAYGQLGEDPERIQALLRYAEKFNQ